MRTSSCRKWYISSRLNLLYAAANKCFRHRKNNNRGVEKTWHQNKCTWYVSCPPLSHLLFLRGISVWSNVVRLKQAHLLKWKKWLKCGEGMVENWNLKNENTAGEGGGDVLSHTLLLDLKYWYISIRRGGWACSRVLVSSHAPRMPKGEKGKCVDESQEAGKMISPSFSRTGG